MTTTSGSASLPLLADHRHFRHSWKVRILASPGYGLNYIDWTRMVEIGYMERGINIYGILISTLRAHNHYPSRTASQRHSSIIVRGRYSTCRLITECMKLLLHIQAKSLLISPEDPDYRNSVSEFWLK